MRIITETVKSLKITVSAGQSGKFAPTEPLELKARAAIRQVEVNANAHNKDIEITVKAGQHTPIDHLPDLQSYSTSAHAQPETAPQVGQADEITATVEIPSSAAPSVDVTYVVSITYWTVQD